MYPYRPTHLQHHMGQLLVQHFLGVKKLLCMPECSGCLDLCLLAGVMACPFQLTSDGHEMQFGTNHLGHFLLVKELLPVLKDTGNKAASNSRVVVLSSSAHFNNYKKQHGGPIRFDNIDSPEKYHVWAAYVSVMGGSGDCLHSGIGRDDGTACKSALNI